jgi:hypothetical protein
MNLLAQIPVEPQHLAWFLAVLFFLVAGLNQVLHLADRLRGRKHEIAPQPLVVQPAQEWVSRAECHTLRLALAARLDSAENGLAELRAQLAADRQALLEAGEERARRLHQRMDALGLKLSEELGVLRGELKRIP